LRPSARIGEEDMGSLLGKLMQRTRRKKCQNKKSAYARAMALRSSWPAIRRWSVFDYSLFWRSGGLGWLSRYI